MPFILSFVASRALFAGARELLLSGHGDHRLGPLLWSPSRHGRDRMNLRNSPVPSVLRTVAPSPCTELAGMLSPPSMAEPPWLLLFQPLLLSLPPRFNSSRPSLDLRPGLEVTLSHVNLLKRPPVFTKLNLPSLA